LSANVTSNPANTQAQELQNFYNSLGSSLDYYLLGGVPNPQKLDVSNDQAQAIQDFYNSVGGQDLEEALYLASGLTLGDTNEYVFDPDRLRYTPAGVRIEVTGYENRGGGETAEVVDEFGNRYMYRDTRPGSNSGSGGYGRDKFEFFDYYEFDR
jgi:hypothetical protein